MYSISQAGRQAAATKLYDVAMHGPVVGRHEDMEDCWHCQHTDHPADPYYCVFQVVPSIPQSCLAAITVLQTSGRELPSCTRDCKRQIPFLWHQESC